MLLHGLLACSNNVIDITVGDLDVNGTVEAPGIVGDDTATEGDETGDGIGLPDVTSAREVFGPGPWLRVATGNDTTCAVHQDGHAECHGTEGFDEHAVPAGTWLDIATDGSVVCGLKPDHTVQCWGDLTSSAAMPPLGAFVDIEMDPGTACGQTTTDQVVCWVGAGETMPAGAIRPGSIEVGAGGGCALSPEGNPECWNAPSLLGMPPAVQSVSTWGGGGFWVAMSGVLGCSVPTEWGDWVAELPTEPVYKDVRAMSLSVCATRMDGRVDCWGDGSWSYEAPFTPLNHLAADINMCGIGRDDSELYCWGPQDTWAP